MSRICDFATAFFTIEGGGLQLLSKSVTVSSSCSWSDFLGAVPFCFFAFEMVVGAALFLAEERNPLSRPGDGSGGCEDFSSILSFCIWSISRNCSIIAFISICCFSKAASFRFVWFFFFGEFSLLNWTLMGPIYTKCPPLWFNTCWSSSHLEATPFGTDNLPWTFLLFARQSCMNACGNRASKILWSFSSVHHEARG